MDSEPIVEARGIRKRFPNVLALDGVDFMLRRGEIHALLGENGSGKTTLASIMYGTQRAEAGEILVEGKSVAFRAPSDALAHGIALVHQHFALIRTLTAAQNVVLGHEPAKGLSVDYKKVLNEVKALSERWGLQVSANTKVWQLSVGERERVEILRALYEDPKVLILDEPTAVLTPLEVEGLFKSLRLFAADGRAVVFISHKLDEVTEIANSVTVLRKGKVMGTYPIGQVTKQTLARLMVDRNVDFESKREVRELGKPVMTVSNLWVRSDEKLHAVRGISLEVREREILGVAGVAGNGQKELAQVLIGVRKAELGKITIDGFDVTNKSGKEIRARNIGFIPEDRQSQGLVKEMTLSENLLLKLPRSPDLTSPVRIRTRELKAFCEKLMKEYDIRAPSADAEARTLSGGNAQKLVIAREICTHPRLLVAAEPTRGLDVGATENVRNIIANLRTQDTAVLLISSDLDEILALSDRVVVLANGEIQGEVRPSEVDETQLGMMMGGSRSAKEG